MVTLVNLAVMKTNEIKSLMMTLFVACICALVSTSFSSCQTPEEGKRLLDNYESAVKACDWGPASNKAVEAHQKLEAYGIRRLSRADRERFKKLEDEYGKWVWSFEKCSLNVFKKHFNGSKWECSNDSYSQRFEENNGKITMYLKLHLSGRDGWSKECDCSYKIWDFDDDGFCVELIEGYDTPKGSLWFSSDGYPQKFVYLGMNRGKLYAID